MKKFFITLFSTGLLLASQQTVEVKSIDFENNNINIISENQVRNQTGWVKTDSNEYYHYNSDSTLTKGWFLDQYGEYYYLDPTTGVMQKGWLLDQYGEYYYFDENNGNMQKGWFKNNYNEWYYLDKTNGNMQKGWMNIDGYQYYFDLNTGVMKTGAFEENNWTYYFESNGVRNEKTEIALEAEKHIGKPYVSGATGPNAFDCSGLTSYVYSQKGIKLGRTTYDQIYNGQAVSKSNIEAGDLVFTHAGHVGIYVGNNQMIHSPKPGDVVKKSPVYSFYAGRSII